MGDGECQEGTVWESLNLAAHHKLDNLVGIIGDAELIKNTQDAIISLIKGSKQSNVYTRLEKQKVKPVLDLGLKG